MERTQDSSGVASLLLYADHCQFLLGRGGWRSSHPHTSVFRSALTIKAQIGVWLISAPLPKAYVERWIKQEGDQGCIQMKNWHIGREKLSPASEPAVAFQLSLREIHRKGNSPLSPASMLGKVWQYQQGTQVLALEASDTGWENLWKIVFCFFWSQVYNWLIKE